MRRLYFNKPFLGAIPVRQLIRLPGLNFVQVLLSFLFLFLYGIADVVGQNGVTITSPEEPGPTSANPIPVKIKFQDGVDELDITHFRVTNGNIQNLSREEPNFSYQGSERGLENFQVKTTSGELFSAVLSNNIDGYLREKLKKSVISIDFNKIDELFYLTLNDGIFKIDKNGNKVRVISESHFETPLDLVINRENGNIYVADAEKGQVLVFNSAYSLIQTIGTGLRGDSNSPRGATGLALDKEGNIYVADNFTGNTANQDAVKIYAPNGRLIKKIGLFNGEQIEDPYRIAVDKFNNIYVSESGGEAREPRIIIFDKNYNSVKVIGGGQQGNPGSLVVDDYGYLYAIDYENDFNLTDLFNDPLQVLENYETIRDSKYTVNVFDTNKDFQFVKEFTRTELNLPIDLALNNCGFIYVNNLKFRGDAPRSYFGYPALMDINFDFTLKRFGREDNFIAEIIPDAPGLVEIFLEDLNLFKCGPQPEGEFSIIYESDQKEPTFDCDAPDNLTLNLEADCTFVAPDYSDYITNRENFTAINIAQEEDINGNTLTVTLTVSDEGEIVGECVFEVSLLDVTAPKITFCDESRLEEEIPAGGSFIIPDYTSRFSAVDSCDDNLRIVQDPPEGTEVTETTTITFMGIDSSDNQSDICSFLLTITEIQPDPTFDCDAPENLTLDLEADCTFVAPDYTSYITNRENFTAIGIAQEEVVNGNSMTVTLTVSDEGEFVGECSFEVALLDVTAPEITFCDDSSLEEEISAGATFIIPDYTPRFSAVDSCDDNLRIVQDPPEGTEVTEDTTITFTATDSSENLSEICSFLLTITEIQPDPTFDCDAPNNLSLDLEADCSFVAPDYSDYITNRENFTAINIAQEEVNNGNTLTVTLFVSNEGELVGECSFEIALIDVTAPEITFCDDSPIEIDLSAGESFTIPNYSSRISASDNCDTDLTIEQIPSIGTEIYQTTTVTLRAIDNAGRESVSCSFQIEIGSPQPTFECNNEDISEPVDPNCNFGIPDYRDRITNLQNFEDERIEQTQEEVEGGYEITLTVYEGDEVIGACVFTLTLLDQTSPVITSCPDPQTVTLTNEEYIIPAYYELEEFSAYDACDSELEYIQTPSPGTAITADTQVSIVAVDDAGNRSEACEFLIDVRLELACPGDQVIDLSGACNFQVPDYTHLATESAGATISQVPAVGSIINGNTLVTLTATLGEETASCDFELQLINSAELTISCPADREEEANANGTFTLPDYRSEATVQGNCSNVQLVEITQTPAEGTIVNEDTVVTLTVTDEDGNTDSCSFEVLLNIPEPDPIEITCPSDWVVDLNGSCEFIVPDYTSEATATSGAAISQVPEAGTVISENTIIRLTATKDGVSDFCEFTVILENAGSLNLTCPSDLKVEADENRQFTLADYRERVEILSACGETNVVQFPAEGVVIDEDTEVTLTVTDGSGGSMSCSFMVNLDFVEEPDPLEISCPEDQIIDLEGSCEFRIPDYTHLATTNPGAVITQTPAEGSIVTETTTIYLTATEEGVSDFCEFSVHLENIGVLAISCPADQNEDADENGIFVLPEYSDLLTVNSSCGAVDVVQFPAAGTTIDEDTRVTFTVTDEYGNEEICDFYVNLIFPEEPEPLVIACPADQVVDLSGACEYEIPDLTGLATVNSEAAITQSPAAGTIITKSTTVYLTATLDGVSETCQFELILNNLGSLVIACPADQRENTNMDGTFTLPNYTDLLQILSSCGEPTITQSPAPGSTIEADSRVTFTVEDEQGNEVNCSFEVNLIFPETSDYLEISCPEDIEVNNDPGQCGAVVNFENPEVIWGAGQVDIDLVTGLSSGDLFPVGTTEVTFEAVDDEGSTTTCSFTVTVLDNEAPVVDCLEDIYIEVEPGIESALVNFSAPGVEDVCGVDLVQTGGPASGSEFPLGSTTVSFLATDPSGNKTECSFEVVVHAADEPLQFVSCPEDKSVSPDDNCSFVVPDYRPQATVSIEGAAVTQSPAPGEVVEGNKTVTLTATLNGQSAECSFQLVVEDNVPPVASCVSEFTLNLNEAGYGILSASIIDNGSTDNCGIAEMVLSKTRFTTADIGQEEITLTVIDAAGNEDSCTTIITIEPYEEEVSCVSSLDLPLDENGEAILSLNYSGDPDDVEIVLTRSEFTCDDIGHHTVIATYWGEYTGSCEIQVNVVDNIAPEVNCVSEYDLTLNENGTANLRLEDVFLGATDNCGIENMFLSKTSFTTTDVGRQELRLTVVDPSGNETYCTVTVNVHSEDATEPEPSVSCLDSYTLKLGGDGVAVLDPAVLFTGGTEDMEYDVSRTSFTCADIGAQTVTFTYDTGEQEGSCEILIQVIDPEGHCTTDPVEPPAEDDGLYLIIYPNPGRGLVYVSTSDDITITRAQVFDMRGRFLFSKEFPADTGNEDKVVDLREYQDGVYAIIYHTADRTFIRRAIISRE